MDGFDKPRVAVAWVRPVVSGSPSALAPHSPFDYRKTQENRNRRAY
jgi:hypothetical protein